MATFWLQEAVGVPHVATYRRQEAVRLRHVILVTVTDEPPRARRLLCNGYKRASECSEDKPSGRVCPNTFRQVFAGLGTLHETLGSLAAPPFSPIRCHVIL